MDRKMGKKMSIIPASVKTYGRVSFGEKCIIGEYSIIGFSYVESGTFIGTETTKTIIGKKCIIGSHVIIYAGTKIGEKTSIEDYCRIGEYVSIGKDCRILYRATIYDETRIGNNCIIAGFCCERAKIGNNVRLFGELVHAHREPHLGWDDVVEKSPRIDDYVFIGFGVKIVGGIKIGRNSYITTGAVVTKDVPPKSIVSGTNKIVPYSEWAGRLKNSKFFMRGNK